MPETPSISVEQQPGAVVVRVLARDLDESHMTGLRSGIADALPTAPSLPFIVDLSNVKFVPSLTLGALVGLATDFRSRSQRLIFASPQATVRKVFTITRLDRVLEIVDDVPAALCSVGAAG